MERKTILAGMAAFVVVGIVAAAVYIFSKPATFRGTTYVEPYPPAPEFELTRQGGAKLRLGELRGSTVLLFFGYTSCPDVCPTTLADLRMALEKLGPQDSAHVRVLFVTVDPERDTPDRVQEYVNHFNPNFIGLSGTVAELAKVWQDYGVFRALGEDSSGAGYLVDHTARVTLIDADGNLRVSYAFDTPVSDIVHDLQLLHRQER